MNVQALIEELKGLGVELRAVGDDLEYEGPEEAITPELLERLKAHKAELIAVFRHGETVMEEDRQPAEVASKQTSPDPETRKLSAAGWEPKERCGKIIWKRPDNGFFISQEMALQLLQNGGAV
jgi:hypothetical protein